MTLLKNDYMFRPLFS